jgi:hypothetical protein
MALVSIANVIAAHHIAFMGDAASSAGAFLGWIQLEKPNGEDAGYIYLSNSAVEGRLGGRSQPGGPYIVMSRPISEAALVLGQLASGRPLQIRYHGDDEGSGTGFLEDQGGALDAGFAADVTLRFNRAIA